MIQEDDNGEELKGVISFAIQELCLEAPGKPKVEVRIVKIKEEKLRMTNLDSWESMKPIKKLLHFKFGALTEENMDPFLLNGGMLSFDSFDKEIEINIETKSQRPFMYYTEKWSKKVTIEQVIEMSHSEEAPKLELEKKSSTSRDFCKATGKTFRTVVKRFATRDQDGGEDSEETHSPRYQSENVSAQTEITMKFKVYVT